MKKKILISLLLFTSLYTSGQDIHFSQFDASPMNLNPALTGLFNGTYRFVGNQRKQWSSVPVPYSTFSLSSDMQLPLQLHNTILGGGLLINTDKAGDSDFKTIQFGISLACIKTIGASGKHLLSIGIQPNITNKNFNTNKLSFDNQYNGEQYDPNIATNENFNTTKILYLDLVMGINWLYKIKKRTAFNIGFATAHLNKASQTFFTNQEVVLNQKIVLNASYQQQVSPYIDIIPSALMQKQGQFSEIVIGTSIKYLINPREPTGTALYLGGFYRLKDASIVTVGMDYNNFKAGISYDINTSGLIPASNHRGGFELSLIYILQKFTPLKYIKTSCPVFI